MPPAFETAMPLTVFAPVLRAQSISEGDWRGEGGFLQPELGAADDDQGLAGLGPWNRFTLLPASWGAPEPII